MKHLWTLAFVVGTTLTTFGNNLDAANRAYTQGNYPQAIEIYTTLVKENYASTALFYNLGNAYFRVDSLAQAILFYEKALKISPNDPDIQHNLYLANQKTEDQFIAPAPLIFIQYWLNLRNAANSSTWALFTIIFSWLTLVGFSFWQLGKSRKFKKIGFFTAVAALLLTLFLGFITLQRSLHEQSQDTAVITVRTVELQQAADPRSPKILDLHAGTKIQILDRINRWVKVRLLNGEQGWLPASSFTLI